VQAWTGVQIERVVPFDTLQLWLATALDGCCRIAVDPELDTGMISPITCQSTDAVADGGSFAYLAARRLDETMAEFGVHAFGPPGRRARRGDGRTGACVGPSAPSGTWSAHGVSISSVSAPWLQAMMLEQAQIRPGMRVLEVGSGGYNAALIAELVGACGEVTTVDIDSDVVDRARQCLAAAGYRQVNIVLADAEGGVPDHAPCDRVIVTAETWDIPPAWPGQLAEGGRLVVPLRFPVKSAC